MLNKKLPGRVIIYSACVGIRRYQKMDKIKDNIDSLLIRYWDGSATKTEKENILSWLEINNQNKAYYNTQFDLWIISSADYNKSKSSEEAFISFKQKLPKVSKTSHPIIRYIIQCAAIACVFLIGYTIINLMYLDQKALTHYEILMPNGHKGKVILPDSSIVWLNSNTRISYSNNFNKKDRAINIDGQAYFEVYHNEKKPFIVTANDVQVKVLGTKFDVQNYTSKDIIDIVLSEGSVEVDNKFRGSKENYILTPNQKFSFSKKENKSNISETNAIVSSVWTKDRMTFENKKLIEIIPYVESWYGVKINCDKSLAENTSLTFTIREDSLSDLIESLEFISPLVFQINNDVVEIKQKPM